MAANPIFVGLALLDALLLWLLIGARGKWALKLALIVIVLGFNFTVPHAIDSYRGWPTTAAVPTKTVFVSAIVNEPSGSDRGSIYLWLAPYKPQHDVFGYSSKKYEPRAYKLPYSRALHEAVLQAQRAGKGGHPVILVKAKPHGHHGVGGTGRRSPTFSAYRLPPASAGLKNGG